MMVTKNLQNPLPMNGLDAYGTFQPGNGQTAKEMIIIIILIKNLAYFLYSQCFVHSELIEPLKVSRLDDNMHFREKLYLC